MPYDPQRSRPRPRLTDDSPAPIDALLGTDVESDAESASVAEPASPPVSTNGAGVTEATGAPDVPATDARREQVEPFDQSTGGRSRVVVMAIAALVVVLALAWFRRRRS